MEEKEPFGICDLSVVKGILPMLLLLLLLLLMMMTLLMGAMVMTMARKRMIKSPGSHSTPASPISTRFAPVYTPSPAFC
jgi:flagellar basal body-associated protein FliL